MLSTILLGSVLGCQGKQIPNVRFYAEIPFTDCPEGVFVETVTRKRGIISCEDWKKKRPFMIMLDPEGKKEVFMGWLEACRWAKGDCNVKLNSVRETVEKLDSIAGELLGPALLPGGN